jgi:hypothetical protein
MNWQSKVYLIQLCVTKFVYELLYEVQYYINSTPIRSRLNVTLIYIRDRLGRERKVVLFTSIGKSNYHTITATVFPQITKMNVSVRNNDNTVCYICITV